MSGASRSGSWGSNGGKAAKKPGSLLARSASSELRIETSSAPSEVPSDTAAPSDAAASTKGSSEARVADSEAIRVSMPSGETYASAKRSAGNSSRSSEATVSSDSGRTPSASVSTSTTRRTPASVPITRNPPIDAVASPRESIDSSTPSYSSVRDSPAASEAANSSARSGSPSSNNWTCSAPPPTGTIATAAWPPSHGAMSRAKSAA